MNVNFDQTFHLQSQLIQPGILNLQVASDFVPMAETRYLFTQEFIRKIKCSISSWYFWSSIVWNQIFSIHKYSFFSVNFLETGFLN